MNCINSCILEGEITAVDDECFELTSTRESRVSKSCILERSSVSVTCKKPSSLKNNWLQAGCAARVVGRLAEIGGKVGLIVEHIEFQIKGDCYAELVCDKFVVRS